MSTLGDRRFLIVTGKGGVGKTTVCAAEALALAGRGKKVLVAMCNAKERLSVMLGSDLIGADVVPVAPNIWAVNMEPERAVEEYGILTLHSRVIYRTLFDNKYVRRFLSAVPGLHEWAMLGKAWWHTTERFEDGTSKYDVVILDAPATGHGLDMLRVPKVILDVVPPGLLRRDAERAMATFRDPATCGVVLVTIPEEMPVTETIELARSLTSELRLPIGRVVVNQLLPPLFSKEERATLATLGEVRSRTPGEAAIAAGQSRALRERVQAEALARLARDLPIEPAFLPLLFEDAARPAAIRELAKRL